MSKHKSSRAKRGLSSYKRGHWAEFLCRVVLRLKGYKIIVSRYKSHQGEIDIVAQRGRTLAFVEVKARPTREQAGEAVSPQQQARLARCASLFHAHYRGLSQHTMRFDVMWVIPWHWPIHIENAFEATVRI